MSHLHLRTIEALALAIEAKDHNTHEHLQRVRVYAMEIAKELRLTHPEMEALQAASLLHDIGKLAVPEHIISKPGKLTPEEFEKMKSTRSLERRFWNRCDSRIRWCRLCIRIMKNGMDRGIRGAFEEKKFQLGRGFWRRWIAWTRLASHRQYRPALPLDLAMAKVAAESGKSFDPQVVKILQERYVELEKLAHEKEEDRPQLSVDVKVERGLAPAAGFERQPEPAMQPVDEDHDTLSSIAAARQEAQSLFEMGHDLGAALRLDDTLSMFSVRLRRFVAYDAMVVYVRHGGLLTAEYVSGDNFRLFSSLKIPVGAGLSGVGCA